MTCKADGSSLDMIPESILETILCLLPTEEAARTSILSSQWRYRWTNLSKLEFHLPLVYTPITKLPKPFNDLHQVLLSHQGVIQDFSLSMSISVANKDPFGFDQIILHLSNNHTVKKLKLHGLNDITRHNLPKSVFSLHHLTDLHVLCFSLDLILNGFGSLTTLFLKDVWISTKSLLHLLSNCPLLNTLTLVTSHSFSCHGLSNLKKIVIICLQCIAQSHLGGKDCSVIELFNCLPMIQHLTTYGYVFEWLVLDSVPKELPTLLFHLKYFVFKEMWFAGGHAVAFLLALIKCSPNLEKIKLEIDWHRKSFDEKCSVVWQDAVRLEHLNELEITGFSNLEHEMEFLKFILARSPKLKKVSITIIINGTNVPEVLKTISQAPRASAAIVIYRHRHWKCFKVL